MAKQVLNIKYECNHPSCQVFCKKGEIRVEESYFKELSGETEESDTFKSPDGACRMGYCQSFKAVSVENDEEKPEASAPSAPSASGKDTDLLKVLMAEHEGVIEKLDLIDSQLRTRDTEGLWLSTSAVENDILLHSIKKEEEVLFPFVKDKIPMGEGLIAIMYEDHREFITLLHATRCALQDGEILDGLMNSLLVNLRNHIKKENDEFFGFCEEYLDAKEKEELFAKMKKLEEAHVPLKPGNRKEKGLSPFAEDRRKLDAQIASLKSISSVGGEEMCCGGH